MSRLFAFTASFYLLSLITNTKCFAGAPVNNDECVDATALTIGLIYTTGTVKNMSTSTGIPVGCATGTPDDDVWFKFTIASAQSVTATLSSVGTGLSSSGAMVQLFSGSCGSLTSFACGNTSLTAANLAAGTYYLRVYSFGSTSLNNNADFSIIVSGPPANDDCSNPVSLTSNLSCSATTGTLNLATQTSGIPAGCATAGAHYDAWYSFVATSAVSQTITLSNLGSGITTPEIQLYSGTCNSLSSIACNSTSLTATGLSVGATYYVRVSNIATDPSGSGTAASFEICITHPSPPPANDNCSGAINLAFGSTNSSGTVWAATGSNGITAGCAPGTPDDDVWYKFTATSNSVTATLSGIGSNLSAAGAYVQLFSGSCVSLASLACGYNALSSSSLVAGNIYYLRVYSGTAGTMGGALAGSAFSITVSVPAAVTSSTAGSSRLNEVFQQTILSPADVLSDPWEIAYGPDHHLWITEAKGYKVHRMDPATGIKSTVLDLSLNSSFFSSVTDKAFNLQFDFAARGNPQGGFAGLALHPAFMSATSPKNYVYVSYIHTYVSTAASNGGIFFTNRVVRFTYNTTTGLLDSPVSLCDTLPGSSDHNSQRMIIAPVGGTNYLFYAEGDMGAGQYTNLSRPIKSQDLTSYEGKILRFNLEEDGDPGTLDKWIPNDNPFNGTKQSAVWSSGMRNNQGFAAANINGTDYLYGTSHGPFSDDELNIISRGKNYGHPLVIGYSADGNYDNAKAGTSSGSLPLITSESANAASIGPGYQDPIYTFYPAPKGNTTTVNTIQYIYTNNPSNSGWPSEAPSGMDIYTGTFIPGWKNSILSGALKGGKIIRMKLNDAGTGISAIDGADTVGLFRSVNRFRDIAISPAGNSVYAIVDKSSATSGPTTGSTIVSACAGCVLKYTFLGYQHNSSTNRSTIPSSTDIAAGSANTVSAGTATTIDNTNNSIWVPITGPDGNIVAEIKANGNNLGVISSSFYNHTGTAREDASKRIYLNRSITITPERQPTSTVNVRLYITSAELTALIGATNSSGTGSGVSSIGDLKVLKNNDVSPVALTATTSTIIPTYAVAHTGSSNGGYVLQADISSFSTFYFGDPDMTALPAELLNLTATLQKEAALLRWETTNEQNTSHFEVERSTNGNNFEKIGSVKAGKNPNNAKYSYSDFDVRKSASDVVYYRLKTVDKDGTVSTSKVVTVAPGHPAAAFLYPNPISDVLNIRLSLKKEERTYIQVSDMQGRIVYTRNAMLSKGMNELNIDTKDWAAQTYLVQVKGADNRTISSGAIVKGKQ